MIFLELVINMLSSFLQITIFNEVLKTIGDYRLDNKIYKQLGILAFIIINGIVVTFVNIQIVFAVVAVILMIAFSHLYKINLGKRILVTFLVAILIIVFEIILGMITVAIFDITIEVAQSNLAIYLVNALFSKLILFGLVLAYSKVAKGKINIKIQWQYIVFLLMLPIASFSIVSILSKFIVNSTNELDIILVVIASILLLMSNIFIFLIFNYIEKQKERENKINLRTAQIEMEKQYYQDIMQNYITSNKTYHDLKNKLYAIDALLKKGDELAREEISRTCEIVENVQSLRYTKNDAIDSLLNAKNKGIKALGINIDIIALVSKDITINPIDICVILGNIIDNAINETKDLQENKNIVLEIKQIENRLSITIRNPLCNKTKANKKDKYLHGYGLKNVKEVVQKYNGEFRFGKKNDEFVANIVL